tara:strand:+ start:499 stop:1284 length:786 start_codon:yes stop_codon:yes gene_type:complete
MDKSLQKSLGNLDRMLSKNANINMAVVLFLVVYLACDIKEFVPEFLNNEIVRLVVIALAVYLLLRCNMGKIKGGSHACTVGILLLLAAVLHRPNEGFLGSMRRRTMEGFDGDHADGAEGAHKHYQVRVGEVDGSESADSDSEQTVANNCGGDTVIGKITGSGLTASTGITSLNANLEIGTFVPLDGSVAAHIPVKVAAGKVVSRETVDGLTIASFTDAATGDAPANSEFVLSLSLDNDCTDPAAGGGSVESPSYGNFAPAF